MPPAVRTPRLPCTPTDTATTAARRPRRRLLTAAAASALLLGACTACGYGSQEADRGGTLPTSAGGPTLSAGTVRIGYFASVTHATPLVGMKEGLLGKHLGGTRIAPSVFNAGPSEIEALGAGSIDIGWIGPSPAVNSYVRSSGRSLRIISGATSGGASLVVDPHRVHGVADLRGKRIATPQLGNTQDVALLDFLARRGYRVDAQTGRGDASVERIDTRSTPLAFRQGQIDGAWVPEPTASQLVAAGGERLVDERTLWPGGRFATTCVVVSQTFLAAHPDVVEAVLRGSVETNAWIRAHPDRAVADIGAELRALSGAAPPADVVASAFREIEVTDDPLSATVREEADHAVRAGLLQQPDLAGIDDLTLLDKVLKADGRPPVPDAGLAAPR